MTKATKAQLSNLRKAASSAFHEIADRGIDPTDAVIKHAKANDYNEEWTGRLSEVTNRMLVMNHFETADDDKRAAAHPLVDVDAVRESLFPARRTQKAASVPTVPKFAGKIGYAQMDAAEKAASTSKEKPWPFPQFDEGSLYYRVAGIRRFLKQAVAEIGEYEEEAKIKAGTAARKAARALARFHDRADVEERILSLFGEKAAGVLDLICEYMGEKRAFTGEPEPYTVDKWDQSPYKETMQAVYETVKAAAQLALDTRMLEISDKTDRMLGAKMKEIRDGEKKAAGGAAGLVSGTMKKLTDDIAQSEQSSVTPDQLALSVVTPEDIQFMNSIRFRESLAQALMDPVIAQQALINMPSVLQAYNDLSEMAPRSAMHAASLRALMRTALETPDQSPSQISTLVKDIEPNLAKKQSPLIMA